MKRSNVHTWMSFYPKMKGHCYLIWFPGGPDVVSYFDKQMRPPKTNGDGERVWSMRFPKLMYSVLLFLTYEYREWREFRDGDYMWDDELIQQDEAFRIEGDLHLNALSKPIDPLTGFGGSRVLFRMWFDDPELTTWNTQDAGEVIAPHGEEE